MLRILFITHDFGRLGAQMALLHLMRNLRLENPSWSFRIIGRQPNGDLRDEFADLGPVEVFSPVESEEANQAHREGLRRGVLDWCPHLVYSNTSMNGDVTRFLGLPSPLLVHVHELSYYLNTLDPERLDALLKQPSHYLAASGAVRGLLIEKFCIDEHRVEVLYESLDLEWIDSCLGTVDQAACKATLGVPPQARLVGTVGRIDERKGWDLFVRMALDLLLEDSPLSPWYFLWLGHGPCHEHLRMAFEEVGRTNRLIAPGPKRNPFPYYRALDFFVQTSREDPCPLTTLEAAYLGVPIVVFGPSGGSREVVGRGCGIVLPEIDASAMATALLRLAHLPDGGHSLGAKGPTIIREHHNARQAAKQVGRLFERLLFSPADREPLK